MICVMIIVIIVIMICMTIFTVSMMVTTMMIDSHLVKYKILLETEFGSGKSGLAIERGF